MESCCEIIWDLIFIDICFYVSLIIKPYILFYDINAKYNTSHVQYIVLQDIVYTNTCSVI